MEGTVKFFDVDKGFGFVIGKDNVEYFVHVSDVEKGIILDEDDSVSFEPVEGDRGLKATSVKLEDVLD